MSALCPVCRCQEHDELLEPVITSCGHLFCWTCLYRSVKESPSQEYNCPSCRLIITSVISDNSRGTVRSENERLRSGIPQRPGQGVFPFDFDYGEAVTGTDAILGEELSGESSSNNSQPARRSGRERRVNLRLGGYADHSGQPFESVEQGTSQEDSSVEEEAEDIGTREEADLESDDSSASTESDLPEVERRFIPYGASRITVQEVRRTNALEETDMEGNDLEETNLDEIALAEFEAENAVIADSEDEFDVQTLSGLSGRMIGDREGGRRTAATWGRMPGRVEIDEEGRRTSPDAPEMPDRLVGDVEGGSMGTSVPELPGSGMRDVEQGRTGADENHLEDLVVEAPNGDLVRDAEDNVEQRLNSRYKARDTVEGSQLSHVEVVLLHTRIIIREENVRLDSINYTTVGRSVRRDYPRSFPGTAIKEVPKRVRAIILKAKKDFEGGKKIVPKILRAGDARETRMEETVSTILRISSAAPVSTRHNQNRGTTRRPSAVARPTIIGPGVGNIAPTSSRSPSLPASDEPNESASQDTEVEAAEDYVQERRLRQEQGASLREHSLALMPQRRNNNTRLSAQIETFNSTVQDLNRTRQSSLPPNRILADISRRADQRVDTRDYEVRAREERERARLEERRETRRMDLLLVASITKDKEMQEKLAVTGSLKVYKMLPEPNLEAEEGVSPELPITLNLTRIDQLKRDLIEYLGHVGDYMGIVTKMKSGDKTIVTAVEMISFQQCYVSDFTKSGKNYILLTEK